MTALAQWLAILLAFAPVAESPNFWTNPSWSHARFASRDGRAVELRGLRNCGDTFQTCLTDGRHFAFSYFRNCNDASYANYDRLKFRPKVVSVLHNNIWMVFDAAPNYLIHYQIPTGIVGIYIGRESSSDFRRLLRMQNIRIGDLDAVEYRATSSEKIGACK